MNRVGAQKIGFAEEARLYITRLSKCLESNNLKAAEDLAKEIRRVWITGNNLFICGNGGSAANAIHLANDLHYGAGACGFGEKIAGIKVEALPANPGIITCLANDTGYENIFSHQLEVKGKSGDMLIALSGSGNSDNIVRAIRTSRRIGMSSYAIVAFNGGICKKEADKSIHFEINDMQIAEDTQLIVGHICMQWLSKNKPNDSDLTRN